MLKLKDLLPNVKCLCRRVSTSSNLASSDIFVHRDTNENNSTVPFEFTEANMKRILAIIQNYPTGAQRAALGPVLDIAQRQIGWLPISAMHRVAELLSVPRIRVYEFATFYTMYKRRWYGKYHVKICVTTPCMLRGSDCLLKAAEDVCCCKVGHVSPDSMFGLDTVECAGACTNAPVMVVDDDYYEDLTINDVYTIIQHIRSGCIPHAGPQSGRYAAEPITGLTSLLCPPPPPGFGLQPSLIKKC